MDERLNALLHDLRYATVQTGELAVDAACSVGKQAVRLADAAGRELQSWDLRSEINFQLRELGEMLYATHTGTPTESDALLVKMQRIDALNAQLRALRQGRVCPGCGASARGGDTFCRNCGGKL